MPEKKCKKVSFSEEDAATLTQRYDATTILTVLQEIAHYPHSKIDWNELVKKTSTGISNAREYQMLWRHLAYRDALPENLEDGAEPMDDDSDLDCELEALPPVSAESASEAAACVKFAIHLELLMKVHSPLIRCKGQAWSEEEDMQLRAAVQRWGEGNWATMAKGDNFPIKRSPTQLAQRWSILRKKDGSANSGTILTSTQYTTAEQLATRHSLSLALDMPFKKLTAPGMIDPVRTSISIKNQMQPCNNTDVSKVNRSSVPPQYPSQQALLGSCASSAKSKLAFEKTVLKCNLIPDPDLKSTTVDSRSQIASQSNTISQFKVAQLRKTVGTIPAGGSLTTTSISAGLPSNLKDKRVSSVVDEVMLKQEVNPIQEFRDSDPGSIPKEKVQESEAPKFTTQSQIDNKPDKGTLDSDKTISEHKTISQNPGGSEEKESGKNSNFTLKIETTKNESSNLDKESQDLDQEKRTSSINGSLTIKT
ncbi:SANT/Myb domain [Sesbania bispinosa]|nr:SANT/Myb domain [Sesbania bispinosa]